MCPAEVTEHVFIDRRGPLCRKWRLPQDPLREVAVGRQRLGINLVSLIAALRQEGRLPIRTIQWYLQTVHQLKLSAGAIAGVVQQVAQQARPAVAERWNASAAVRWSTPTRPAGGRTESTATFGPSARPLSGTSCAGAGAGRWWTRSWASPSAGFW